MEWGEELIGATVALEASSAMVQVSFRIPTTQTRAASIVPTTAKRQKHRMPLSNKQDGVSYPRVNSWAFA